MPRLLPTTLTLLFLLLCPGVLGGTDPLPAREPILAGTWYPGDPKALAETASALLAKAAPPPVPGRLVALLAPHAGYAYSGRVAAQAFRLLQGVQVDTVVLVGPSHFLAFDGVSVWDQGDFKTPLGPVPLDRELIRALAAEAPFIRPLPQAHEKEHSLEIELPLLQTAAPGFKLVPLVMGSQDPASCRRLAQALAKACQGRSVLLVASSDLSHFHDQAQAERLDAVFARDVAALDPERLLADLGSGQCEACGGGPTAAVMLAAKALGADSATVLAQATSAQATGDRSRVVGYLAAAFSAAAAPAVATSAQDPPAAYGPVERQLLKDIARQSIQAGLEGKSPPARPKDAPTSLLERRGAFVTLKIHGELRGCIGHIEADTPLASVVAEMARAAALQDPRFPPLRPQELAALEIQISVLTPPRAIDPAQVKVGRDGLIVRRFPHAGLLLPQVATEYGWDRETFLGQTCAKAGMQRDCWKDKATELTAFTAEVF